ncbi:uncharacterized protein PFL1_02345 [Pseudozyma flocculosa PF-1]|uniref:Uncharacterized protein n=1 Tax=Pseudozyma flocculosa TaxID=84751 RepID=A0A5C3F905_9BASI|nr:uncharacterized protein PFL1_02345 [Pseudozyma flocculosa PF-1]EPQ30229.1 hypothetical protein PFL1_02345 [Pseudozyma flocculosa PF-1]SPO39839.1 uncharacterized protein PSFLO_05320 [Pseudozyma flocculosa]
MPERFKLHPDPHERRDATFSLARSAYSTVLAGGKGSALLIPHILLPIYGVYWTANRFDLFPTSFVRALALFIALTEGLAAGAIVGLGFMRYGAAGKAIKGRRNEKTATDEEIQKQQRVEVALRAALYILIACIYWEYLVHSPYSPMTSAESRNTSSGLLTSSGRIKDYLNNESLIPTPEVQNSGVGVGIDFNEAVRAAKETIDHSPKIRIGEPPKPKSEFLQAVEWFTSKIRPKKAIGLVELGPKTWQ